MTPQELKAEFDGMELPESIRISPWENVTNVHNFIESHYMLLDQAGHKWERTPAWERLLRLRDAMKSIV